jgi:GT2 family glycosyltransferase
MYTGQKTLSVVIPVRESQETITLTVESLLSQTKKPDEIIVVSRVGDSTKIVLQKYIDRHQIVYIETNEGSEYPRDAHINRWIGANCATSDYIFFTDSKVIFENNSLEAAVMLLEKNHVEALGASVYSWPSDSHRFVSKIQDKSLLRNNPIFPEKKILDKKNFGKSENLPVTTGLLVTRHAFNLIKNDFALEYSRVASTYDDYATAWLLVNSGIKILLTNQVITYHKHRLQLREYLRQVARSGQSAALLSKFYPECPFSKRRQTQMIGVVSSVIVGLLATVSLVAFQVPLLYPAYFVAGAVIFAGITNVIKSRDLICFLLPPITLFLILHFSYHYWKWQYSINTNRQTNVSKYVQI